MSTSALMELLPAPPEVIEKVEKIIEETGEAPSVRETREMVKDANPDPIDKLQEEELTEFSNRVGKEKRIKVEPQEVIWQKIVDTMGIPKRMEEIAKLDYEDEISAYLLFGLDPIGSVEISPEALTTLCIHYRTEYPSVEEVIDEAYDILKESGRRRRS